MTEHDDYYDDDEYYDTLDYWIDECGQVVEDGLYQCLAAGTEDCQFFCPFKTLIGKPAEKPPTITPRLNDDGFPF